MSHIYPIFLMIKFILYFSICLAANPLDMWIDEHKDILKQDIKSVSFYLTFDSEIDNTWNDSIISGKITVGTKKQFRFEMGPRTVVSDGKVWKSYDERTDQIFIQQPDKKLEKSLFSWVKLKKIKALPVKLESDVGYRLKLLGKENDVRAYFNPGSNQLESIIIIQSDMKSEISKITLAIEDVLNLDIGNQNSASFDLR